MSCWTATTPSAARSAPIWLAGIVAETPPNAVAYVEPTLIAGTAALAAAVIFRDTPAVYAS